MNNLDGTQQFKGTPAEWLKKELNEHFEAPEKKENIHEICILALKKFRQKILFRLVALWYYRKRKGALLSASVGPSAELIVVLFVELSADLETLKFGGRATSQPLNTVSDEQ